jgi:ACS family sodium-dependent inorganic phosphate cotransporter
MPTKLPFGWSFLKGPSKAWFSIGPLTIGAVSCNHFDIAPKNAGTVFGIGNTASCIGGAIAVPASGFIYDQTHSWDAVFLLFSIHYIGGALAWIFFSSDKQIEADNLY